MARRILIADDNPAIRHAIRLFIERNPEWQVCGEAENGKTAVELVSTLNPDVLVLDMSMPLMNGLEAAQQITASAPSTKIVLFTAYNSELLREHARQIGIKAVVSKDGEDTLDDLACSLRKTTDAPLAA